MFTITAAAKVLGVVFALILFGVALVPTEILFTVVGGLSVLAGLASLVIEPRYALILLPLGAGMLTVGLRLQRKLAREQQEEAENATRRVSGLMDVHIPRDE